MIWTFPDDVRGWLTPEEGLALSELASGKAVLEIGSFCGLSTICMAQTAEIVHAVDPFDCRATPHAGFGSTFEEFEHNTYRYGVSDRVKTHIGTSEVAIQRLPKGSIDLVFIDGNHSHQAVLFDTRVALHVLRPGGLVAFHDYKSRHDPEVEIAVQELIESGAKLIRVVGTIAVVDLEGCKLSREPAQVAIAMCRRGPQINDGAAEAFYRYPCKNNVIAAQIKPVTTLLTQGFNIAWAESLNVRDRGVPVKYFAMIHDDIEPEPFWLDTLIEELESHGADACAAVVPIKHDKGCTSTAIATDDRWLPRRLTMHEVYDLPETFTAEDAGGPLLLNTGLWVVKLTEWWAEKVCFRFENRIRIDSDGRHIAEALPEDWLNSYDLNDWGAKLIATRKVKLVHSGNSDYPNDRPWGLWKHDEAFVNKSLAKEKELCGSSS
jgi:hypothetical protein